MIARIASLMTGTPVILLMNGTVPLINRYTRPRIYGQR